LRRKRNAKDLESKGTVAGSSGGAHHLAAACRTFAAGNEIADSVVYNLGTQEVTVDSDGAAGESAAHKLFNGDGSHTIQLEDNAFFPYEVQFSSGSALRVEVFDTPDSTVVVDGHVFGVATRVTDYNTLSQIGFTIGDTYIPAVPAPKIFTSNTGRGTEPMLRSMLPLNTVNVRADLRGYLPSELKSVKLSTVLSGLDPSQTVNSGDKVVWVKKYYSSSNEDDFKIADQSDSIDLSANYSGNSYVYLELIVGSAFQLDLNNKRYVVEISITPLDDTLQFELYTQEGSTRADAGVRDKRRGTYGGVPAYLFSVSSRYTQDTEFYLGMSLNSTLASSGVDIAVYKGRYATAEEAAASGQNVTSSVLNQTMANLNAGLLGNYADYEQFQSFTLVYSRGSEVTAVESFMLYVYLRSNRIDLRYSMYDASGNGVPTGFIWEGFRFDGAAAIRMYTCKLLSSNYTAAADYLIPLRYYHDDSLSDTPAYITKAVVGHFDTLEAAASAADIKEQLFGAGYGTGYLANYSGDGQNFTVFAEDEVYQLTIKVVDYTPDEPSEEPSLSQDTYFRVQGALSGNDSVLDTFVMPYKDDTYYSKGYQTVFINHTDTDLATLKPLFWVLNPPKAYAGTDGAVEQTSGVSAQDFSKGPVLYTAKAEDGRAVKNYAVTFVKKVDGEASLFVNGPDTREVFLDDAYENRHDVFIANVGTLPLTGLNLVLDATNLKLDQYWRVGGTGNDTLNPFTTADTNQIDSIAKIRLLPAEPGEANYSSDGNISGTLTITSANGGSRTITLTGKASNPKIITEDVPKGVKYVPYSVMIQTNNMHDWNKVEFSLEPEDGLPDGLEFLPNGEIYGVPKETGTFAFTVKADYSYYGFADSEAEFTLVIEENTDANVDAQVDAGYAIETRIPATVTVYRDYEFKIEGAFKEFQHVYIDGVELQSDQYTVEDGSTKITVRSQTFSSQSNGTHTIAGEFRVDGDRSKEMKKAAQNYTLDVTTSGGDDDDDDGDDDDGDDDDDDDGGGGSGGGSGGGGSGGGSSGGGSSGGSSGGGSGGNSSSGSGSGGSSSSGSSSSGSSSVTVPAPLSTTVTAVVKDAESNAVIKAQLLRESGNADKAITVTSPLGDIVIDEAAVKAIGGTADVAVSYKVVKDADGGINISVTLIRDRAAITNFGSGIVMMLIPYTRPNGIRWTQIVPYYNNNGKLELVMGGYNVNTKRVEIQLRHLSDYVVKVNDKQYEGRGGWYDDSLDWAVQRDLLNKFIVDGQINAAQNVSRSDFVAALMKALGIQPLTKFTVEQFYDVSGENAAYIRTARQLGIVSGIGGNKFDPDRISKRGEQFQIVYNLIQAKISTVVSQNTNRKISDFRDADTVPEWLRPALSELLKLGVVQGDGTNLNVKDDFTIGQISVVLQRMATPKAAA
jgi:hypothetical protein